MDDFEQKCRIGENGSYISSLIRDDLVDDFISYVNRNKISLSSRIKNSFFENNSTFYIYNASLIEYAAYFGSIQIFQYLKYNKVKLTSSLWLFAVHSNNPEMIHILEYNEIKPEKISVVIKESIKCHHNDITNYLIDNYFDGINDKNEFYSSFSSTICDSFNFQYFSADIEYLISKNYSDINRILCKFIFITKITIPSYVTNIGCSAFSHCSHLEQITIPSYVTNIGYSAFSDCLHLTQITIPSSVTNIGDFAFNKCQSLNQIKILSALVELKESQFHECFSLKQIIIPFLLKLDKYEHFHICEIKRI